MQDFEKDITSIEFADKVMIIIEREFPNYEKEICEVLKNNKDVFSPTTVVAGGAVASAVFEALGLPIPYRYKDLDIFLSETRSSSNCFEQPTEPNFKQSRISGFDYECEEASFGSRNVITKNGYHITNSATKGKLNFVTYFLHNPKYEDGINEPFNSADSIIKAFDINVTQVALCKGRIHYSQDFLSFLYRPVLKVINYETATHSITRLFEKSKNLNLPIDKNSVMNTIEAIRFTQIIKQHGLADFHHPDEITHYVSGWLLSHTYKRRFDNIKNDIYLSTGIRIKTAINAYPIGLHDTKLHEHIETWKPLKERTNPPRITQSVYIRKATYCYYTLETDITLREQSITLFRWWTRTNRTANGFYQAIHMLNSANLTTYLRYADSGLSLTEVQTISGIDNCKRNNPKNLIKLNKLLRSHRELGFVIHTALKSQQKTLAPIAKTLGWIDSHMPEMFEYYYTAPRYMDRKHGIPQGTLHIYQIPLMDNIDNLEVTKKLLGKLALYSAYFLSKHDREARLTEITEHLNSTLDNGVVTELHIATDIKREGSEMRHCIASRTRHSKHGDFILSIKTNDHSKDERSSIHIARDGQYKDLLQFQIREHRGYRNGDTPAGHNEIANALLGMLHDPYYQAILKQYEDYHVASAIDTAPMEEEEINSLMESYIESSEETNQYEPYYADQCDEFTHTAKEEIDSLLNSYREPSDECDLEMMLKYDSLSIKCEPPAYLTENTPTQEPLEPLEPTIKDPSEFQNCPF
ncbi:PcfJ domain-containing protein [Vibrio breoganii]